MSYPSTHPTAMTIARSKTSTMSSDRWTRHERIPGDEVGSCDMVEDVDGRIFISQWAPHSDFKAGKI